MPKITDSMTAYGGSGSAAIQPRRGVIQGPSDGRIDAIADLGDTIGKIGQQVQDREDKLNYARAKSEYLKSKIQIESEFENDNDYQTYGDRYKAKATKARDDAVALIRNPMMRESFQFDTDVDIEQGLAGMAKKAFAKEKDNGRAKLSSLLDDSQKLIVSTGDPAIRKSAYENVNQSVDSAIENNWLTREDGVNLKREFAKESALQEFTSKSAEDQLQMLKDNHAALQFIPADKRQALGERAASSVTSKLFLQKRIENLQRAETYDQLADMLEEAEGDISAIPGNAFLSLNPEQQKNLRQYGVNLASGKYNVTDVTRYHDLKNMAANPVTRESFLNKDLTNAVFDFAPTERKELINLQAKLRNKDPETEKMLDGYRTVGQRLNDTLIQAGINTKPKAESDDAKSLALLRDSVERSIIKEKERLGKKELTAEDEQRIIDRELIKQKTPGWFGTNEEYVFKATIDDISDEDMETTKSNLQRKNIPVTESNILKAYIEKKKREALNGK